ncbi:hypothetical protein GWO43_04130 [candidate division KSB1 bacterium]|nr:hypothetical protein [candidate division KSB1 bacterium]NIR70773.1 hypothetical protein [candidate division KSB1 bacterium]NIS23227.1 hypothetical protein [candidate division KSB1 bacterium]NIT70087.1 hypothetical protein [candidate division KSB1 bacterium]NIU23723.1 hypothetical protein [candidate division KSB1 bacterium]
MKSNGEGPQFVLDYISWLGSERQTTVKFYVQIAYDELQFIRHEERFQASYDFEFFIYDGEDNLLKRNVLHDVFEVDSFETQSRTKARIFPVVYPLEPRKYRLKAVITDLETNKTSKIEAFFLPRDFHSQNLQISEIQLCTKIEPGEPELLWARNNLYLLPNIFRTLAYNRHDLYVYFEIYNLALTENMSDTTLTLFMIFENGRGEQIRQIERQHTKIAQNCAFHFKFPKDNFFTGEYVLTIRVRDDATRQTVETSTSFAVIDLDSITPFAEFSSQEMND